MTDRKPTTGALCGSKRTKTGGECTRPAGWGTDHSGTGHCKLHGGSTPNGKKYASRLVAVSLAEAMSEAEGREVRPDEALLTSVRYQQAMVAWARGMVSELTNSEVYGPVGGGGDSHPRYEPHVLLRIRGEEEDRLVKLIKTCHDMNIAERQVRLAESFGEDLAEFARGLLEDFGLTADPRAPEVVRKRMMLLAAQDTRDAA